jgi:hypothetical protein
MAAPLRPHIVPRRPARGRPRAPDRAVERADAAIVERAQRARIVLDVAAVDLEASESRLGLFHPATCHYRAVLAGLRRDWDRLRAELGTRRLEAAVAAPPRAAVVLERPGAPALELILIGGRTYAAEPIPATPLAPVVWRLTRLPPHDDGPYHAARLRDGSTQCDCAEWTYDVADVPGAPPCKHLAALAALGRL